MTEDQNEPPDPMINVEQVGHTKSIGYLPLNTIMEVCGRQIDDVKRWAEVHHLRYLDFAPDECNIKSGALYVWDDSVLLKLLSANAAMLAETDWPTTTEAFVVAVATRFGDDPRVYELIGRAFNDFRFPLDSPVLTI